MEGFQDEKFKAFLNYLEISGHTVIKKSDHELLLSTQSELNVRLKDANDRYEQLKSIRYDSSVTQHCGVIETLAGLIALKPISYLDEFGKPVRDVTFFKVEELDKIRFLIMHHVTALEKCFQNKLTD